MLKYDTANIIKTDRKSKYFYENQEQDIDAHSIHTCKTIKETWWQTENEKVKVSLLTVDMILYIQRPRTHNHGTSTAEISNILYRKNRQIDCK